MQSGQDAGHSNGDDAEDAVPSGAHNQQHHNGDVRPGWASCTISRRLQESSAAQTGRSNLALNWSCMLSSGTSGVVL